MSNKQTNKKGKWEGKGGLGGRSHRRVEGISDSSRVTKPPASRPGASVLSQGPTAARPCH